VIAFAAICAYATFCLLFTKEAGSSSFIHRGQFLQPQAALGMAFDDVRFDSTETGKPQLAGWWIPAKANARYAGNTILLLHDGWVSFRSLPRFNR